MENETAKVLPLGQQHARSQSRQRVGVLARALLQQEQEEPPDAEAGGIVRTDDPGLVRTRRRGP